jgi:hypothetical protein
MCIDGKVIIFLVLPTSGKCFFLTNTDEDLKSFGRNEKSPFGNIVCKSVGQQ